VTAARALSLEIEAAKEQITESGSSLFKLLEKYMKCSEKLHLAANYAHRASDVDTQNTKNLANARKIDSISVEISSLLAFIEPFILKMPEEKLENFYQEAPQLEAYRLYIDEVKRLKEHRLNPEIEVLLTSAGEIQQAPGEIFRFHSGSGGIRQ